MNSSSSFVNWNSVRDGFNAFWANESIDGGPLVQMTANSDGVKNPEWWSWWSFAHNLDKPEIAARLFLKHCREHRFMAQALPSLFVNFGAGVEAAFVGATPQIQEHTVWFETPMEWDGVFDTLHFDAENVWWKRVKRATEVSLDMMGDKGIVAMTDLGGMLDVLASLRGTETLLMDLMTDPDKVKQATTRIRILWHRYFDELSTMIGKRQFGTGAWMGLWAPTRWYPLQCDFSAMISPDMFGEFVLPDLAEQCDRIDRTIYHWDGPNEIQHLDHLLSIEKLDGIQWVPGDGKPGCADPQWWPLYERIQKKHKRLVLADKAENIRQLIGNISPEGLCIQTGADTEAEAASLLTALKKWKKPSK